MINHIKLISDEIKTSPIRKILNVHSKKTLFEEEREILAEIDKIIQTNEDNLQNPLKIVVLGEVKAGKSTLVNALVGKKVSYTNVVEATAAIMEIKYGKEEIRLQCHKEDLMLSSLDELDELMDRNKDNQEFFNKISKISITTSTERLKEITLVDTPGLGTVTVENGERTENYIAEADVILWVINAHHLGKYDIEEKLEEVLDYGKPIIGIINRIDEINGDTDELVEYVENEMGYMFSKIFTVSAQRAWEGYTEQNTQKITESGIQQVYTFLLDNIEKQADDVQMKSIMQSMNTQLQRDLYTHKKAYNRLQDMLTYLEKDIEDIKTFNNRLKQIIDNKIADWLDNEFYMKETRILLGTKDEKEFIKVQKQYSSGEYIYSIINDKYEELNDYIMREWFNNNEKILNRELLSQLGMIEGITSNTSSIIDQEGDIQKTIIEGAKQGGLTAGAVGVGLAGYAALLGPAAASITVVSAVSAFVPPLFLAGLVGGGMWKFLSEDKQKTNRPTRVEQLVYEIRLAIKRNIIGEVRNNLYKVSDSYCTQSEEIIVDLLKQCNTSTKEIKALEGQLTSYINSMERLEKVSNHMV